MQHPAPLVPLASLAPGDDFPADGDPAALPEAIDNTPAATPGDSQRIALLVRDGVHRAQVEGLIKLLELRGHDTRVLAERLGSVLCSDGSRLAVDASLRRWPAWYFDSAVRLSGAGPEQGRLTAAEAAFLAPASDGSTLPLTRLPWPASARRTH